MGSSLSFCGIILSAGFSTRMGRDKALLPWPPTASESPNFYGQTLLTASIASLKPFADSILVVAGKNSLSLAPRIAASGANLVINPTPELGQFGSLQVGLRELLAHRHNAAIITLVDCPPLSVSTIKHLRTAFGLALAQGRWAVAPEHNGRSGHPLFANRPLIDAFLAAPISSNARQVKHSFSQFIERISVPDELLSVDVNTPEQYNALAKNQS
jgi:molybdenum cofactor cytidylyltransferase